MDEIPGLSKLADERPFGRRNLVNALKRTRANETGLVAVVPVLSIPLHPCQGGSPPSNLSSRPERTRISCYAALPSSHVCGFQQGKPHEVRQRHQPQQEIRGSVAEGSAVSLSGTANVPWASCLRVLFLHERTMQIPRLRYAPVGMTNCRAAAHLGMGRGGWTESTEL